MKKSELIKKITEEANVSRKIATDVVNTFINIVKETITKEWEFSLRWFGTFKVSERKARTGRNPRTGEAIEIPARKSVRFKAGSDLKEAVNS